MLKKLRPFERLNEKGEIIKQLRFIRFSKLPDEVSSIINDFRREMVLNHNIKFYKNNFDHRTYFNRVMRQLIRKTSKLKLYIHVLCRNEEVCNDMKIIRVNLDWNLKFYGGSCYNCKIDVYEIMGSEYYFFNSCYNCDKNFCVNCWKTHLRTPESCKYC